MSTAEVAAKLVQHCREGKFIDAIEDLYADNVESTEPMVNGGKPVVGKEAVIAKNNEWYASVVEVHSAQVSEPVIGGDYFSCAMDMDVTYKEHGRMQMSEICVYEVKDGKVTKDMFFYRT